MSPAPGKSVTFVDEAFARAVAADPSTWFVVGFTRRGPQAPVAVRDMNDVTDVFGERVPGTHLHNALDVFFQEGGGTAVVTPLVGTDADVADGVADDFGGDPVFDVLAAGAGAWGNDVDVEFIGGSGAGSGDDLDAYTVEVSYAGDVVEVSPAFGDLATAVGWARQSNYIRLRVSEDADLVNPQHPTPQTVALAGGVDDRTFNQGQLDDALALFTEDYGPGVVSAPGLVVQAAHESLLAHCADSHRTAYLDLPDTADVAALAAAAVALRDGDTDRAGGAFAPWALVPGVAPNTTRAVPYSAVQAGMTARNDSTGEPVGQPAAGKWGVARYATALTQEPWDEADRTTLNDAGVNVARVIAGEVRTYGNRTVVNPDVRPQWVSLSGSRTAAVIANESSAALEGHVHAMLDGRGHEVAKANGDIVVVCLRHFDSLYGATPEEAFTVDTGPTVNTSATAAQRKLRAKLSLKTNESAERAELTISKQAIAA